MYELVSDILRLQAADAPDAVAITAADHHLTYQQAHEATLQVAAALVAQGIRPGDRVAVLARNRPELALLYFATAQVGATLCPLNVWHRAAEHDRSLADCDPASLWCDPDLHGNLPAGRWRDSARRFDAHWPSFLATGAGGDPPRWGTPESDHLMLYTSGTTGPAKGVLISQRRTIQDGYQLLARLHLARDDRFLCFFPPFHVGNWDVVKLFWMVGARVHYLREFDEQAVLQALEQERISVLLGMPTMFFRLLQALDAGDADLAHLRLLWIGGFDAAGASRRMLEALDRRVAGLRLAHTYGLTEAGPYVTVAVDDEVRTAWGSVGRPPPGVEIELRDEHGRVVPAGQVGELWYRGPMLSGYWRDERATAAVLDGRWLATGDLARQDDRGRYWLVDRKKDVIRTGSQNVYCPEVERALLAHPKVAQAAVFGTPDAEYEERVTAALVPAPGCHPGPVLAEEIRRDLARELAGYKVPRQIVFLEALPTTAMGKVRKAELRELAVAAAPPQARSSPP